jgi:murein DD-endopeptidase MepM/ murein hydrolase activator NlpD
MRGLHRWTAAWAAVAIVLGGGPAHAATAEEPGPEPAALEIPTIIATNEINEPPFDFGIAVESIAAEQLPPPEPAPPAFVCPVSAPVRFGDTFGEARSGHRHMGVDLTAPYGTPTVAPIGGVVRFDRDWAGGLSWHLTADDGTYYYGTHLSKFGPHAGRVEQGEVIGYVGQSGNASMSHLHFEIRPGGISSPSINPTPFATKYCTQA